MSEPLIALLEQLWSSIDELCRGLTDHEWPLDTDCPGWTVKDQLAHMVGTEQMLLGEQPPPADIDDAPHVRNDVGRFNEQWIEAYRAVGPALVLDDFRAVTAKRLDVLRAMTPEQWDAEGFTPEGPGPYRSFMAIRAFDCWFHEQDIREAVDRPGDLEGPVADHALGRIAKGLPYVVGKKAGAPQGATVVFDVTGKPRITVAVGVDGRAAVLDAVPADPTVRLTMDRRSYARLAGGRWRGRRALDEGLVAVDGDAALGRRVVEEMGFTI